MNQRMCVVRSRKQGPMPHRAARAAGAAVCLAAALLSVPNAAAETKTWAGTGVQDWFDADLWDPGGVPGPNDDVVIAVGGVSVWLTNETASLKSFSISGTATLVFSNWTTRLRATTVDVGSGGTITCAGPFTNAPAMSNRVWVVCSNLTVQTGGQINVNEKGFAGVPGTGQGPGGGYAAVGAYPYGASHGGHGAKSSFVYVPVSLPYGSASAPLHPGSSGGGKPEFNNIGGHGGGAIRIEADGAVAVHGVISANATLNPFVYAVDIDPGWHAMVGGGSGGSIYITCRTFAGSGGSLAADGGKGNGYAGRGGGGRIAVVYNPSAQRGQPVPAVQYRVRTEEVGAMESSRMNIGTLYFSDGSLLPLDIAGTIFGQVRLGVASWAPDHLTVNNAWLAFTQEGLEISVTNAVTVTGSKGLLELGGSETVIKNYFITSINDSELFRFSTLTASVLRVGGNLILTNSAKFYVYSAPTNATTSYGALVDVAGDVRIENNSWFFPCSHPTNTGGAPLFRMRNLTVPTSTAGFNADGRGYFGGYGTYGYGDGGGNYVGVGCGGGYGGVGGANNGGALGGGTYGSSNAPAQPGSGGGTPSTAYQTGGNGGGLIAIEAQKNITLNGLIQAIGGKGGYIWGGGGSGGGIDLQCSRLAGTGRLLADGGVGRWGWYTNPDRWIFSGSGGGGRIAVARQDSSGWSGTATANGAINILAQGFGGTGTVVWVSIPWPGTVMTLR